jgi:2-methylcitrate dehydratase PrpD
MGTDDAVAFARTAALEETPDAVREAVRVGVLDTLAAATAGYRVPGTDRVRDYALARWDGPTETELLDGSDARASLEAAALADGTAANALDVDDGLREVKGHPAAVVVPPAVAAARATNATVGDLLDAVYVGYELAVRAGLAIHATDGVYTGTGSWGALGAAAAVCRLRSVDAETLGHALGTAEYHAPRTPIMRGVERPGMTKDGVGWGAAAGTAAALLAERGFTGSGTVFDDPSVAATDSLFDRHYVTERYLKPFPCCRWAHPGVEAVLSLRERREFDPDDVRSVRVETFEEATHLTTRRPDSVEAAEYSYPYPVAVALVRGEFGPEDLLAPARTDESVLAAADCVDLVVDSDVDARFPAECLARVEVETSDGTYRSPVTRPPGARERPLSEARRLRKARDLFTPTLPTSAVDHVRDALQSPDRPVAELFGPW